MQTTYQQGIQLFNAGKYWEAHEQWEDCWRIANEPDATFYKGIIQSAAALVHWQRGNNRGLVRNWYKARPRLVALAPTYAQLHLTELIGAMDSLVMHEGNGPAPVLHQMLPHDL